MRGIREESLAPSADEAVDAAWLRPSEVLERHGRGEITLYPPTWVTLHSLTGPNDVADLLAVARLRGIGRFETVARRTERGPLMLWPEDAEYAVPNPALQYEPDEQTADAASGARHRLDLGALPWIYTRSF